MEQKKRLGLNARLGRRAILGLMTAMPAGVLFSAARNVIADAKELATELVSPGARGSLSTEGLQSP